MFVQLGDVKGSSFLFTVVVAVVAGLTIGLASPVEGLELHRGPSSSSSSTLQSSSTTRLGTPPPQCHQVNLSTLVGPAAAPSKYVESEEACCEFCAATHGCEWASFSSYLCSPKTSEATLQNTTYPSKVLRRVGFTPSPSRIPNTTSTESPAPTWTTTVSPAPTQPSSSPSPTTATPAGAGPHFHVVARNYCPHSNICEGICTRNVFKVDQCYTAYEGFGSVEVSCAGEGAGATIRLTEYWRNASCAAGSVSNTTHQPSNTCLKDTAAGGYVENHCLNVSSSDAYNVTRTYLEGGTKYTSTFSSGKCHVLGPDSSFIAYCSWAASSEGGPFVWVQTFATSQSCRGSLAAADSIAYQMNAAYPEKGYNVTWSC